MRQNPTQNHLANETSPYLLQHSHNPVDWYPWGQEALERASQENRPIFLSIGYSACHWCHVMAHESFEDPETASIMNAHFINIKVDREERPDLDHIYMSAVQLMSRHGGWPMSVFLTPDLKPFFGGTYFPPEDRMGLTSFKRILSGVANAWKTRREELLQSSDQLLSVLTQISEILPSNKSLSSELMDQAVEKIVQNFDSQYGGFGGAPKFFHTTELRLCLRSWKKTGLARYLYVVTHTLDQMSQGGIYDQLGGGFHRYSTDDRWLVPHFEKMLYDNALLVPIYLETFQATGNTRYATIARETLDFVLREMTSREGFFYSALDADSENEEGKFYVWDFEEITQHLGNELGDIFASVYGVSTVGNWEGKNILHQTIPLDLAAKKHNISLPSLEQKLIQARKSLLQERSKRIRPFRDEKALISWNGLMVHALSMGSQVLDEPRYLEAAQKAMEFLISTLWNDREAQLFHSYCQSRARFQAYLDDYACLIDGAISLFEVDCDLRWLKTAINMANTMCSHYWDETRGAFYFTATNHEPLILRTRDYHDGSIPSSTAMAITALARLGRLTTENRYLNIAESALKAHASTMEESPMATAQMLFALDFLHNQTKEIIILPGADAQEYSRMMRTIFSSFVPNKIVICKNEKTPWEELEQMLPMVREKRVVGNKTTVYVCENYTCQKPSTTLEELTNALNSNKQV